MEEDFRTRKKYHHGMAFLKSVKGEDKVFKHCFENRAQEKPT